MNWYKKILNTFGLGKTSAKASQQSTQPTPVASDSKDYSSMKVAELKAIAKERGVKGYYKLKKAELISTLNM